MPSATNITSNGRQPHSTHDVEHLDHESTFSRHDGSLTFTDTAAPPVTAYYRLVQN